jgi:hypothetical protein
MFPYITNPSHRARTKNAAPPRPLAGAGGWGVRVVTARKAAWLLGCSLTPHTSRLTQNAGTVPGYFLNASTLGLSLRLCTFASLRSNNPAQFRWLTH